MINDHQHYIAGLKTPADWYAFRNSLSIGSPTGWHGAFTDFFETRLELRYLHPIKLLQ